MSKLQKIDKILLGVFGLIFIGFNVWNILFGRVIHWLAIVVMVLLLGLFLLWARNGEERKGAPRGVMTAVLFLVFITAAVKYDSLATLKTTRVTAYEKEVAGYFEKHGQFGLFPKTLPENITDFQMYSRPGMWRHGPELSVSFVTDEAYIAAVEKQYSGEVVALNCKTVSADYVQGVRTYVITDFVGKPDCDVYVWLKDPDFGYAVDRSKNRICFFDDSASRAEEDLIKGADGAEKDSDGAGDAAETSDDNNDTTGNIGAEDASVEDANAEGADNGGKKDLNAFNQYNYMVGNSILSTGNNLRLKKVLEKLRAGETINLATLGGSVTEGAGARTMDDGYAYRFAKRLADEYGNGSNVNLVNAGLSGTPSSLGAMRYQKDILDVLGTTPDILILEFAVNDYQEATAGRALESLAYQALTDNEDCAVILLFSISRPRFTEQDNMCPTGYYYQLPMVSMKNALLTGGMKDADYFYDDYHPRDDGHELMCDCLIKLIMKIDEEEPDEAFEMPESAKRGRDFTHMQLIYDDTEGVVIDRGAFTEKDTSIQRMHFGGNKLAFPENYMTKGTSGTAGLKMTLECTKLMLNFKTANDKSYGEADIYVDGKKVTTVNGYDNGGWNNCNAILVYDGDKAGKHTLEVKMAAGSEDKKFTVLAVAYN